ncbi:MAG TPA: NosD domain-containing protein [Thermoanaerobaculia bacterium]|jgi:parallel beta-helix repeat protein|nr:NosD domain-containing protein [Thermoanaerobaculia bacterium]
MTAIRRLGLACSLALALLPASAAAADPPRPVIAAATRILQHATLITKPGLYTLGSDFAVGAGEKAIVVQADDVTIDLGGRTLSGPGGPGTVGIEVDGARNVGIRNGSLVSFGVGVLLQNVVNARLEGLRIDGEDLGGAPPNIEIGILLIDSRGVVVTDNQITETFLGIFVRGAGSGGNRIAGNTLAGGEHGQLGICYNPAPGASAGGPSGDLVYANLVSRFQTGIALSADSRSNVLRENTLATFATGVADASAGGNALVDNVTSKLAP